jgi:formate dehydrogenase
VAVARDYASAPTAAIMFDLAVEQNLFSTLISYLIRVLSVLTGNVGSAGGNTFMETQAPPEWSPKRFEEPERTLATGIRGISAMGGFPMFSPTLVPEEILVDHPERLRALVVEASNPILSYSDTKAWREAREKLDLLVVMDVSWTETAELADYVLPAASGYEKYELAGFPKAYPEVYMQVRPPVVPAPGDALPEPEFYAALGEAMGLWPKTPDDLFTLAEGALEPAGAMAYLGALMAESGGDPAKMLFWTYRALGPHLPSPALAAVWVLCHQNAMGRREGVLRTLGAEFENANPFELAHELFRRILAHPEGTEIAKGDSENNLASAVGWDDGRIRLAPEELLAEIPRAIENGPTSDPDFPFVLALGLRTRWTANTIQRDPAWRQGRGPFCALHLSPGDAMRLDVAEGDPVRITTRRGDAELPAAIDEKLRDGHVWIPNGFGAKYPDADGKLVEQGINLNELSDAADRDPITGCPHHKATPCRVERAAA